MNQNWIAQTWLFTKNCRNKVYIAIVLGIFSVFLGLVPYLGVYFILQAFFTEQATMQLVVTWLCICLGGYVGKHVLFGVSTSTAHDAAYSILESIRHALTGKMMRLPLGTILDERIGTMKNTVVDQVETIELPLSHLIPEGASYALLPLTIFIYLFMIDWRMALISIITVPLAFIPFSIVLKTFNEKYDRYMQQNNQVNSVIVEYMEGIEVIKTFNQSTVSYKKFENAVQKFKEFTLDWFQSSWKPLNLGSAILPTSLLGTLPLGLYLYSTGDITPYEYILCIILSLGIIEPLTKFTLFTNNVKQIQYAVNGVQQFLDLPELPTVTNHLALSHHHIEVKNVDFCYKTDGPMILNNLSFTIPHGQFIALVGPSGSGKSTIAKLIARFWDVSAGSICIGGQNIQGMPLQQLADEISFVTQDNFLFNTSLLENIRLGKPTATDEEVLQAAKAACCDDFIMKFEKGYDTTVGEAGGKLSGGEKQRIAIARAILKDAPIVILDEATAYTDPDNELKIQQSISHLTKEKTLIVIAHRLSTIKYADVIYVLQGGAIVEEGTHTELLMRKGLYQNMWETHIGTKQTAIHHRVKEVDYS